MLDTEANDTTSISRIRNRKRGFIVRRVNAQFHAVLTPARQLISTKSHREDNLTDSSSTVLFFSTRVPEPRIEFYNECLLAAMARIKEGREKSPFEKRRKEKRGTAKSERKKERMRVKGTKRRKKEVKWRDEKCGETDKTNYFILRAHIQKSILDPEFRNCRRLEPSSSSSLSSWLVPAISAELEEKGSIKLLWEKLTSREKGTVHTVHGW